MIQVLTLDFYPFLKASLLEAQRSVCILAYVINFQHYKKFYKSTQIFNLLLSLPRRGVTLNIILDSSSQVSHNHRANFFAVKRLTEAGIHVRMQATKSPQHAKAILFDDRLLLSGSHNLTEGSLSNPFELSFAITHPPLVSAFSSYYRNLYTTSLSAPWARKAWPKSKTKTSPFMSTPTQPTTKPNPFQISIEAP